MWVETTNPTTGAEAVAGSMIAYRTGSDRDTTTQALALKLILNRVAVSPHVALLLVAHAGLGIRERR